MRSNKILITLLCCMSIFLLGNIVTATTTITETGIYSPMGNYTNVTASYYFGDGSQLTGVSGDGLWTDNSGVATYDGDINITGNISMGPTQRFYLDGGEHTYIAEHLGAWFRLVIGGTTALLTNGIEYEFGGLNEDTIFKFVGGDNNGEITYMEDEDYFEFDTGATFDGKVGINTNSPDFGTLLHMKNDSSIILRMEDTSSGGEDVDIDLLHTVANASDFIIRNSHSSGLIFRDNTNGINRLTIKKDGNVMITNSLDISGSNITRVDTIIGNEDNIRIGDAGVDDRSLTANDDLFVSGKLEVDGTAYFDSGISVVDDGYINMRDGSNLRFGNDLDVYLKWSDIPTVDILHLALDTPRVFEIVDSLAVDDDYGTTNQEDPMIKLFSSKRAVNDTTEWLSLTYSSISDRAEIETGKGDLYLNPTGEVIISGDLGILGSNGKIGIGTTNPDATLHIFEDTTEHIRLSYDVSNFVKFFVNSLGILNITTTGGKMYVTDSDLEISSYNSMFNNYENMKSLNTFESLYNLTGSLTLNLFNISKIGSYSVGQTYPASSIDYEQIASSQDFGDLTDFSNDDDYLEFWFYVSNYSELNSMVVELGNTEDTNEYQWIYPDNFPNMTDGWNKVILHMGDAIQGSVDWSTGVDHFRIFYDSTGTNSEFNISIDDLRMTSNRKESASRDLVLNGDIIAFGDITTNNTVCFTLDCSSKIYHNGTNLIISGG